MEMNKPNLPTLEEIFHAALALTTPEERLSYLNEACADDEELKRRAEALLEAHLGSKEFLEVPLVKPSECLGYGPGSSIGPYRLLQEIGEGGMGVVYMAEQESPVRRKVALKIIKLGMDTKQVIARFEAERQALALMEHPNIARVFSAGATDSGRPYFVMELVRGVAINEYCDTHQLSTNERMELFIDTCRAVQHAHQKGIIHRDIKPGNVLVTSHDGRPVVKIIDFGVAKATNQKLTEKTLFTEFRQFIGTPEYMSPEQAEMSGLDVDTRTDIYSLGVLFYQLLAGSTPFDAKTLRDAGYGEMTRMIREDEPQTPSTRLQQLSDRLGKLASNRGAEPSALVKLLRGDLDWIVMKAISKDRTRRYDSASELADDVLRHMRHEPVLASPPSSIYRTKKWVQRNRGFVVAGSLVTLSMLVGLGLALGGYFAAKAEAERSSRISSALTEMLAVVGSEDGLELEVREILATAREAFGEDHATVAATLSALAGQLRGANDLAGAQALYEQALVTYRSAYGDVHPAVGRTLGSLGIVQSLNGLKEQARASMTESLRIEGLQPGQPALFGCGTRRELARMLSADADYAQAEGLYVEALQILRSGKTRRYHQELMVLEERLVCALADPEHRDLEPIYTEIVTTADMAFPEGNLTRCTARFGRAMYLAHEGRKAEAEPGLRSALAAFDKMESPPAAYLFSALDMMFQILRNKPGLEAQTEADDILIRFLRNAPLIWKEDDNQMGQNLEFATGRFRKNERYEYALETALGFLAYAKLNTSTSTQQTVAKRIADLVWDVAALEEVVPSDLQAALQVLDQFPAEGAAGILAEILRATIQFRQFNEPDFGAELDAFSARPAASDPSISELLHNARELSQRDA